MSYDGDAISESEWSAAEEQLLDDCDDGCDEYEYDWLGDD